MKSANRQKRAGRDGQHKLEEEPVRGPGTLTRRITNLKSRLKPEQVQKAEKLLKGEEFRVVQLAWYMHSQQRVEQRKARMVQKYREGLKKLLGADADHDI